MAGGGSGNTDEPISNINVTPLVDIMLVLVIILMVTAEFTKFSTMGVKLPKVNAVAAEKEPYKVVIKVLEEARMEIGGKKVAIEGFPMKDFMDQQSGRAKSEGKELSVVIDAEEEIPYLSVLDVVDQVNGLGIDRVGLAVKKVDDK